MSTLGFKYLRHMRRIGAMTAPVAPDDEAVAVFRLAGDENRAGLALCWRMMPALAAIDDVAIGQLEYFAMA